MSSTRKTSAVDRSALRRVQFATRATKCDESFLHAQSVRIVLPQTSPSHEPKLISPRHHLALHPSSPCPPLSDSPPPLRASRPLLAQPLPSPTLSDDFRKRDLSMALDELAPTLETPPALTNRPWFVSITPTPPVFVFLFRTRNRLQKQAEVRSKWRCKVFFYSFAVMMLSMLKILRALFLSPSVPPRALKS